MNDQPCTEPHTSHQRDIVPTTAPIKRVAVIGATFGRMYVGAIRRCPQTELVALLTRGSQQSRSTAEAAGVPLITSIEQLPDDLDLACVAVRADSIGGHGTAVAVALLERGIPVLQELPAGAADVTDCLRAAHRGKTRFTVADLYRRLPSVTAFRAAAAELIATERPLAIDAQLSIQPAWALAHLLVGIGISSRPASLTPVGGTLMAGTLGGIPIAVRYATLLDARDTDNDVRFPAVSVHTASGTLTLADVHGPVLWTPTLHLPNDRFPVSVAGTISSPVELARTDCTVELAPAAGSHADLLSDLWPTAVAAEVGAAIRGDGDPSQRILQVAQLWQTLTSGVEFPTAASATPGFSERAALLDRLRVAAAADRSATNHPTRNHDDSHRPAR